MQFFNAKDANMPMTRIDSEKLAKFATSRDSRSKMPDLSSDFAAAIKIGVLFVI